MKIGIITFHNSDNYGAVLQTFALKSVLDNLEHDVRIIDYICKNKKEIYRILRINKNLGLKYNVRAVLDVPFRKLKKIRVDKFTKENYRLTKNTFDESYKIKESNLNYDMYICGSDQIWNYENTKFDKTYFLDFVQEDYKKMSYAASFGVSEIKSKYINEYKQLLNNIKYISVREKTGENIIKNITNRECEVVLDPTLLLDKKFWITKCNKLKNKHMNYILLYSLHNSKEIYRISKQISEKTGYKVLKINTNGIKDLASGLKNIVPGPLEFVNLINNAKYVVTDSFHGTAFSINLNKNFFVYLGKEIKNNSRIQDLLYKCDLTDRIVTEKAKFNLSNIDYTYADDKLNEERKKSINFIENSLRGIDNEK